MNYAVTSRVLDRYRSVVVLHLTPKYNCYFSNIKKSLPLNVFLNACRVSVLNEMFHNLIFFPIVVLIIDTKSHRNFATAF